MLKPSLIAKTTPKANADQIRTIGNVRITYLSPRLIRVECGNEFTDLASKTVFNRCAPAGMLEVSKQGDTITAETQDVVFTIEKGIPYSVFFKDSQSTEIFSRQKNLKGTCRTLDNTIGKTPLKDGLITESGAYLLDDSKTMLLDDEGHFVARQNKTRDCYAFAYGKDYRETINAFYTISGRVPLIPRFALGVWWSRYHAYTQQEYLDLMARFKKEEIPLTVATVDMDWHWVRNIGERFGVKYGGWTGYSWDTDLFPDYKDFLKRLKDDNLHITLNLHPADGVHAYEDMYEDMARAMGVNPATKEKIDFRCGSDKFWNAYFDILHKPYERDGVDFWWIDWQQGKKSDIKGLDPLEALNHYHFLDNAESGQMPLILSRYAGLGSHRYPLGFSGDTSISWRVLDFQPYFTINAANAAYTWWSHDIGGHHMGYRDDDLYMRWIQFGVFSPIMRLHSTAIDFLGKEPWKYRADVYMWAKDWLRLRHKLIPYIFTMNYRTHREGIALCEPMYYAYPNNPNAYEVKNQYFFGSELIVCPITSPQHTDIQMGSVKAWIPEGRWTDIFTNQVYDGEQSITLFRELNSIPVLAREGAIIPLSTDDGNKTDNPDNIEILAFSGNGEFTLIEDNGKTDYENHNCTTKFEMRYEDDSVTFTINRSEGDLSVIPERRSYTVRLRDLTKNAEELVMHFDNVSTKETHIQTVEHVSRITKGDNRDALINLFSRWQANTVKKNRAYRFFDGMTQAQEISSALSSAKIPDSLSLAIREHLAQA